MVHQLICQKFLTPACILVRFILKDFLQDFWPDDVDAKKVPNSLIELNLNMEYSIEWIVLQPLLSILS